MVQRDPHPPEPAAAEAAAAEATTAEAATAAPADAAPRRRTPAPTGAGRRWREQLTTALLWTVAVMCLCWAGARLFGLERGTPAVQLMAFTPYAVAATLVAFAAGMLTRRTRAAVAAALAGVVLTACVLPRAMGSPSTATGVPITVMAVNLRVGAADTATIVELVRRREVDVLAVQELTPGAAASLATAGLATLLPFQVTNPIDGVEGSAIYARFPLRGDARVNPGGFTQVSGVLEVPGVGPVGVESVHPVPPTPPDRVALWAQGLRGQTPAPSTGPPRVLAGDFNATLDHAELRRLLDTGYLDAADAVGAGLTPTWPYHGARVGVTPKVAIDHVLVDRRIGVLAFAAVTIAGSDHRAIFATLIVPLA